MQLTPAQEQIVNDTHRFRVVVCGRKFGKTTLGAEELKGYALYIDNARVLYIAPTLSDARGLMWERLKEQMSAAIIEANDTRLELKVKNSFGGTSDIYLGSWEKIDNYRGFEYDFELYDEVQDYRNFWMGWNDAMRPTLTPRKGTALFMGTSKGFNHLYDLHNLQHDEKHPEYKSFKFTTYDNPHIDPSEIDEAKRTLPEDTFAREYLAEFRKAEGLVFKEFSREFHVFSEELRGYSEKLAGVDWGFRNPAAVPTVLVKDGTYYVTNLLYKSGITESDTADYVASQRFNKVYPDPENQSGIEELKRRGVNIRTVSKGKDSIAHGNDRVRELFLSNRLFIHSSCLDLIGELETYSYPDARDQHNLNENPIDSNNHAIDALRYVLMSHTVSKPMPHIPFKDKTIDIWRGK